MNYITFIQNDYVVLRKYLNLRLKFKYKSNKIQIKFNSINERFLQNGNLSPADYELKSNKILKQRLVMQINERKCSRRKENKRTWQPHYFQCNS